ncbi:MAG: PKD domain-containing protein, partial [Lachnospiraceae bacterium]
MKKSKCGKEISRVIAILLTVTMLPFADFAGCFSTEVYGAEIETGTEIQETDQLSENEPEGISNAVNTETLQDVNVETTTISEGTTLEEDWTVDGELVLTGAGYLDLNGHILVVNGDFIHSTGSVCFNGGQLVISGDYRRQKRVLQEDHTYAYDTCDAYLSLNGSSDYLRVEGDIYDASVSSCSFEFSKGCIELKGDFYQHEAVTWGLGGYSDGTFVLSGSDRQTLHFAQNAQNQIGNLKVENISEEGVLIEGNHMVYYGLESERESHIEGITYLSGYGGMLTDGGYYAGSVEIGNDGVLSKEFEFGQDVYTMGYYSSFQAKAIVGGDLYIRNDLTVTDDLTVSGNVYVSDTEENTYHRAAYLYVRNANVHIGGDFITNSQGSYAGLEVRTEDSYVLIEGDYHVLSSGENYAFVNYGVVEVKGNICLNQKTSFTDGATLILSGDSGQTVRVNPECDFDNIIIENRSEEGVSFETGIHYEKLTTNDCTISYLGVPLISGYELAEDTVMEGDIVISGDPMNLNGHRLTVKGKLLQKDIPMNINNGELIVEGDYYIGETSDLWQEGMEGYSHGSLNMTNQQDHVLVEGDFYLSKDCDDYYHRYHPLCDSLWKDGILEIKGDMVVKENEKGTDAFCAGTDHTLLLSGTGRQRISFAESDAYIGNLSITNSSEEGVEFIGEPCVNATVDADQGINVEGFIKINKLDQLKDGYYPGDITDRYFLNMAENQKIEIGGDLCIRNGLAMEADNAYLKVNGDFSNQSASSRLKQGTLELEGDFTDTTSLIYGEDHRVLFSGDTLQTIQTTATLGTVELQNPAGVYSERAFLFAKLITNGYRLIVSDEEGMIGDTMTDDEIIDGNLYLVAGELDLNGHTLVVKGDLILQEGTILINHGKLVVEGDYRQQFRSRNEDGFSYSESAGILCMSQEDDILQIKGDIYLMPSKVEDIGMENGTVILDGEHKQTITASEAFEMSGLCITNSSAEGVIIDGDITVIGVLSNENGQIKGNHTISVTDLNHLENGYFGGNLKLTESCTLEQDLDIRGTLSVDNSTKDICLYCNDRKINVYNLEITDKLYVQKARIETEQDLHQNYGGRLYMQDSEGYVLVRGTVQMAYTNMPAVLEQGTLEIKGDYQDQSGGNYGIDHRVLLSGSGKQTVNTNAYLGTLELQNYSDAGVYSATTIYKKRLIDNGCRLVIGDGTGIYGYTLTEDLVVDGDLTLLDDTLDLNGYTMTVKGNLILQEGELKVNGGTLIVEGDLKTYARSRSAYGGNACGCLVMEKTGDLVKIAGDWYIDHQAACNCSIHGGIIELQGNMIRNDYYSYRYDIDCPLILNGTEKQTINVSNLYVKNLVIKNDSESGVYLERPVNVTESIEDEDKKLTGNISISDFSVLDQNCFKGNVTFTGNTTLESDVTINGMLTVSGTIRCGDHTLRADNLEVSGKLYIEHGSVLVNENMNVLSYGILYMEEADSYVLVKGNFQSGSASGYRVADNVFTDGVLEIKGNYTDKDAVIYGKNHKIIMSGTALQKIDTNSKLGILELQNYSQEGICSDRAIDADHIIMNGCVLKIAYSDAIYGRMLTEDYVAAGSLTLYGGTLDLNGKTMTVKGDLTLNGGKLFVNGGTLIVEGNLNMSYRTSNFYDPSSGCYVYPSQYGCLRMTDPDDKVVINGDWNFISGSSCDCRIESGMIILKGNLKKTSGKYNNYSIGCNLILNGTDKQTICVDELTQMNNLTLNNQSEEGIEFESSVSVLGEVYQQAGISCGSGGVVVQDLAQIKNGVYDGKVILQGNSTLDQDVIINGILQIDGELNCKKGMLQADTLIVNGKLVMTDEDAYVLVKENLNFNSTVDHNGFLTNGVLEIMGNISIAKNCKGFVATGQHHTIFRRRNVVDETTVVQRITFGSYSDIRFAKLELTQNFQSGYANTYSFLETKADEVIYVRKGTSIPAPVERITTQQLTEDSVTLFFEGSWEQGSLRGFWIYRDGVRVAATSATTWQDKNLEPDKTYTYKVYPYNKDYQPARTAAEYAITTLADTQAPETPQNLTVEMRTGSAVTMKWDQASDNVAVAGYRLYRDDELVYEGKETYYKDLGLDENTLYTYQVKAFDTSENVSEAGEKVDGAVYMPRIDSITPADYADVGGESVKIIVQCKNEGHSKNSTLSISYYDSANERYVLLTNVPIGQPDTTGSYQLSYDWAVSKIALEGDVDLKLILTDSDGNKTEKIVTYVIDKTAPAIPQSIMAQDEGGTVTVSWEISKSADCTGYRLYRVNTDTGEGCMLADIAGRNSSWYSDQTVEDHTSYNYYVRAYDQFDNLSPMSPVAGVETGEDTQAPRVTSIEPSSGRISGIAELTVTGKDNRMVTTFHLFSRRNSDEEWEPLATLEALDNRAVYAWDTTDYEEGNYYIKAVAVDANGNESADLFMRRYEVDNTGIAKIRLLPATAGSTTIQLEWEDVTEADFGWFIVEENVGDAWVQKAKITDKLGYRAENLAPESTHTYRVTGYDNLGNAGIPSDPVTVTTVDDTTAPSIAAIEPVSSYYRDSIPLSMKVRDNAGVAYGVFSYSVSGNGFEEIASVSGNGTTEERLSHTWDISALPEGEVTVRFEAYDTAGIHNTLYEEKQIENTYIIDRMPPDRVTGVGVTGDEGCISLKWDSVNDHDVAFYIIERAGEDEPFFRQIGTTNNTLYYTDTDVRMGCTYTYRIAAVDIAGNQGEVSDEITATVRRDEEAPVVTGISPSDEIIGSRPTLKVLAMDNAGLASITVEYRNADEVDIWHEIETIEASGRERYQEVAWDTDGLSEGTVYEVRAKAKDAAGNVSEYVTRSYRLDLTAPAAPELTVKSGSFCIETEYSENDEEDFRCYKIYRKAYGEREYTCIQATIQNDFTDAVPETDTTYYYKVRAYDIYGNYSESTVEHSYANHVDKIAPVAELPETIFGFTGMEVGFDGMLCSDNVRINRYEWDFGDGTKTTGVRPAHSYEKAGTYNVTLTVRDAAGNEAVASAAVQIMDRENSGMTTVKVLAEDGTALSGAYVYIKTGNEEQDYLQLRTDVNGEAKVVEKSGVYEFAAFATGYLPGESTMRISNYEELEETVTLAKGEVVTGELTVERMELDELIEKGVDLSAPENYHTFKFKTELWFAASPLPVVYDVMVSDELLVRGNRTTDCGLGASKINNGNGTLNIELLKPADDDIKALDEPGYSPAITYLQTTQSISWLKDMYDVQLGIINNADSGFTITNASATINLPEGMSLATTKSGQTYTTKFDDIEGQERASASWVVRGDATGTYDLSASFHGVLQPFEADIDAQFEAQMECEVKAGEGIVIYVSPEDAYYPGEDYYIQFRIVNESDRSFYNLTTSLGEYQVSSGIREVYVKDYETGELIRDERTGGKTYRSATATHSPTLPVLYEGDVIDIGVFSPGQVIYGTYCVKMGEYTSDTTYFELIDHLVTVLEGENTGVEVRVTPISSHIFKYVLYTDYRKRMREAMESMENAQTYGDPIDMTTGAFLQELDTIHLSGGSDLSFNLYYNSMLAGYKGEAGYGWSHDYEQSVTETGSSLTLHMSPYSETGFLHEMAMNHEVYGVLKENTIILDDHVYEEGYYYPLSDNMEGWYMEKTTDGYHLYTKEGAVYDFDREGFLTHINTREGKGTTIVHGENMMTLTDDITKDRIIISYDENGCIRTVTDGQGRVVTLEHIDGELTAITGVTGAKSVYSYDSMHHMTKAANANGIQYVENAYDEEGRVIAQREAGKPGKSVLSYGDTEDGGVQIEICNQNGGTMTVVTDEKGQKIRETASDGAVTEYLYDSDGNLLDERDAYGNTVMYMYDDDGNVTQAFDTSGNMTQMDYDENGNVIAVRTQNGDEARYTYDENNRLVRNVSLLGEVTRYAYDEDGNVIRQVKDGLGIEAYTYENGRMTSRTDAKGNTVRYTYDAYGNILTETDKMGNVTAYTYDLAGKVLTVTTPDGNVTSYSYDAIGQKIKETITAKDGQTRYVIYTYDAAGNVTSETDHAGRKTEYRYDSLSNLTETIYPDGSKETNTYDAVGNMTGHTDANGIHTDYTYDLSRNVTAITTAGRTISYEYYPNGKVYRITDSDGEAKTYYYDNGWNCIKITDGAGNSVHYTYDAAGNRTSETDPLGNRTQYIYDNHGRCIRTIDPNGNQTSYAYDANGNTIRVTDALGNVTEMKYDACD